jgi:D-alanine-D-alanine ligase
LPDQSPTSQRRELVRLADAIERVAPELALFLVYDRPERATERPGLERAFFTQRCVSDEQLRQTIDAFRSVGAYVRLFEGERPFIGALADGTLSKIGRRIKIVYNGIEGSIADDAFQPGRKALIPAVADSFGISCANSNAYGCALGRHKFHYLTVLAALGLPTPRTWHYRPTRGWAGGLVPPYGLKVIVKSTYESWSVGVTDESIFHVDATCTSRVTAIATEIGQAVTVQEFVSGREVCVPVLASPAPFATPPVEAILAKAPGDPDAVMTVHDNLAQGGVTHRVITDERLCVELASLARSAFEALELSGFGRIDFRVDASGRPYIFDVGVSPGLSTGSSAFASISALGLSHAEFLRSIVGASLSSQGLVT